MTARPYAKTPAPNSAVCHQQVFWTGASHETAAAPLAPSTTAAAPLAPSTTAAAPLAPNTTAAAPIRYQRHAPTTQQTKAKDSIQDLC